MAAFDLLMLVSRVLLDARFFELHRENGEVKRGCLVWRQPPLDLSWYSYYSEKLAGLDRLPLVSRAFMDAKFLELKRENERLKLELFWKNYNIDGLHAELYAFHQSCSLFHCWCASCANNGRLHLDEDEAEYYAGLPVGHGLAPCKPCQYKPWFEDFIVDMQMIVAHGVDYGLDSEHFRFFETVGMARDWFWGYGSRLVNARSVASPDLRKLEVLFDNLYDMRHAS